MWRFLTAVVLMLAACPVFLAQHGAAPNGYYPYSYHGDTWNGTVTSVNDKTREVTLTFTQGGKSETFVGVLEKDYMAKPKDGAARVLNPSDLPQGTIQVFYYVESKKVEGKRVQVNTIFLIKGIPNLASHQTLYMAF